MGPADRIISFVAVNLVSEPIHQQLALKYSSPSKSYVPDISTELKVRFCSKVACIRATFVFSTRYKLLRLVNSGDRKAVAELLLVPFPMVPWYHPEELINPARIRLFEYRITIPRPNGLPEFISSRYGNSLGSCFGTVRTISSLGCGNPGKLVNNIPLNPWTEGSNSPEVSWLSAGGLHFSVCWNFISQKMRKVNNKLP